MKTRRIRIFAGPNGSGKSTLMKIIAAVEQPDQGRVTKANSVKVGLLSQVDKADPNSTVGDVVIGDRAKHEWASDPRIREIFTGLFGSFDDHIFDRTFASLSGGERQMLAISRALISDPSFLLLDEPTAALSPLYQQQIIERIDNLRKEGITVLIVEQNARLSLARSDRGYIFANGKVVHTGDADFILNDPEIGEYFLGSHDD